ncbi:MAG: hypothetical protein IJX38_05240 [Clostridia bacterium]|nr:hypothetical protein [Clostridia bacterium]
MKKILSMLLATVLLLSSALGLVACGEEDDIPEYMQEARGGDDVGYHFYVPEGWIIANYGNVSCAYVSSRGMISVSFTEAPMPEGYAANNDANTVPEYIKTYFASEVEKLDRAMLNMATTEGDSSNRKNIETTDGERCDFGNATEAYRFYLEYTYEEAPVKQLQIFSVFEGRFGIFTYTSFTSDYSEDKTYFDRYYYNEGSSLGAEAVIKEFEYVTRRGSSSPSYTDGYTLISDKTLSGFELSVPAGFRVNSSSGAVSATKADGTTVAVSKATINVGIMTKEDAAKNPDTQDYWRIRIKNLEQVIDKYTDSEGNAVSSLSIIKEREMITVGDDNACEFEYTYMLGGDLYHVYMVFVRHSVFISATDYVYTYTVKSEAGDIDDGVTDNWSEASMAEAQDILHNHLKF